MGNGGPDGEGNADVLGVGFNGGREWRPPPTVKLAPTSTATVIAAVPATAQRLVRRTRRRWICAKGGATVPASRSRRSPEKSNSDMACTPCHGFVGEQAGQGIPAARKARLHGADRASRAGRDRLQRQVRKIVQRNGFALLERQPAQRREQCQPGIGKPGTRIVHDRG